MDTDDIRTEVTTADGKRHTIHVRKQGYEVWTASGYAGADFLEGERANRYEAAVENWKLAYEQMGVKEK